MTTSVRIYHFYHIYIETQMIWVLTLVKYNGRVYVLAGNKYTGQSYFKFWSLISLFIVYISSYTILILFLNVLQIAPCCLIQRMCCVWTLLVEEIVSGCMYLNHPRKIVQQENSTRYIYSRTINKTNLEIKQKPTQRKLNTHKIRTLPKEIQHSKDNPMMLRIRYVQVFLPKCPQPLQAA